MVCKRYGGRLGTNLVALGIGLALLFSAHKTLSKTLSAPAPINPQSGTLILNELSPWGGTDKIWVELINPTEKAVPLKGWSLRFLSGAGVALMEDAPDCPAGALVLVRFGRGTALPRLKDRTVHLQVPLAPGINPGGDGCILEGPQGPVDGLRWGRRLPGKYIPLAVGASLWPPYGVLRDEAMFQADDVCIRLPHTWPPTFKDWIGSRHWVYRSGATATPGKPNAAPGPTVMTPSHGARIASRFSLAVLGMHWAGRITFKVARDAEFRGLVLEQTVTGNRLSIPDLPPGTYYWRVRSQGHTPGMWSRAQSFTVLPCVVEEVTAEPSNKVREARDRGEPATVLADRPMVLPPGVLPTPDEDSDTPGVSGEDVVASHVIGCPHIIQGKDTDMVCLDGCPRDGDSCWEDPHVILSEHDDLYCSRAALAMIASLAGCTLSQDRITYYIFEEADPPTRNGTEAGDLGNPFADLGHHMGTYSSSSGRALEWIYNQPAGTADSIIFGPEAFDDGDPADMDTLREFIDDGRPLIRQLPDHSTVVDGYRITRNRTTGEERILLRILDPAREDPFTCLIPLAKIHLPGLSLGAAVLLGILPHPAAGAQCAAMNRRYREIPTLIAWWISTKPNG